MANLLDVDEKNWETEVLTSDVPVLVDFWAPWCGPCKALSPTVEAVAQELAGRVKVVKCNIDDARSLANKYNVMGIPVLMLFKNGKVVEQLLGGNLRKDGIISKIEGHL
jgi:thioredoxin 1